MATRERCRCSPDSCDAEASVDARQVGFRSVLFRRFLSSDEAMLSIGQEIWGDWSSLDGDELGRALVP